MEDGKKCVICGELLIGIQIKCCSELCKKERKREIQKQYRERNREKIAEDNNQYREDNKENIKQHYENGREELVKKMKQYRENNKKKLKDKKNQYQEDNKEKIREQRNQYREENREKISNYTKQYAKDHKEEIKKRKKRYQEDNVEKIKEQQLRHRQNPVNKLHNAISSSVRRSLKSQNLSKNRRKWEDLVGYTTQELKKYLESLFTEGMSWANHGEWHIDHIIPKSFFVYSSTNDTEFKMCWRFANLQPLWAEDNLSKHNKITLWGKEVNAK